MSGSFRQRPPLQLKDLRSLRMSHFDRREAEVYKLRRLLFGIDEEGAPHLNALRKGLESRRLQHWYPPSKYSYLDFRLEQYVTMQAQRFSAREASASLQCLRKTLLDVFHNRAWIEPLVKQCRLSKELMKKHPTLQDLSASVFGSEKTRESSTRQRMWPEEISESNVSDKKEDRPFPMRRCLLFFFRLLNLSDKMFVETPTDDVPSDSVQKLSGSGECYLWRGDRERFGSAGEVPVPSVTQHSLHKTNVPTLSSPLETAEQKMTDRAQAREPTTTVFYAPPTPLLGLHPDSPAESGNKARAVPLKDSKAKVVATEAVTVETRQTLSTQKLPHSAQQRTKRLDLLISQRYRFIDPLYARRRTAFLRRTDVHKLRPKKRAALAHYSVNPQAIREFPSHRGALFVRYPSVHK